MKIEKAIDQQTFQNEFVKAHINLIYTAGWAQLNVAKELKQFNISVQQFNILRILRGRAPKPASVRELTDRMLDKSSNASRLVDKLHSKQLVEKQTCPDDSRKLEVKITEKGEALLRDASSVVESLLNTMYSSISESEAEQLNAILDNLKE